MGAEFNPEDGLCATETFREIAELAGATRDPSEVFFPVEADSNGKPFSVKKGRPRHYTLMEARFERIARATCAECPVRIDCLYWTMEKEEYPWGIAGGLDATNRSALLSSESPVIEEKTCICGITIFGVPGTTPNACSANCRGEK